MMMKRVLVGVIVAVLVGGCGIAYDDVLYDVFTAQPSGIALGSAEELAKIGLDEDYPLNGSYYLASDITLPQGEWTPIGTSAAPFNGVLEGEGMTIRGLILKGGSTECTGLFGYILNAQLSDFTVEVENTAVVLISGAAQYAGVVVGWSKASSINGVTVKGDGQLHLAKLGASAFSAGGLVGKLESGSVANITVGLNLKATGTAQLRTGLVAGESAGCAIASCAVKGSIDAATLAVALAAGGIVGYTDALVESCVSTVTRIYAENSGATTLSAGGIVGTSTSTTSRVVSCRVEADHPVTIQAKKMGSTATTVATTVAYAGGIGGSVSNIDKCVVDADIAIIAEAESFSTLAAGGIVGDGENISNSFIRRGEVLARAPNSPVTTTNYYPMLAGGISGNLNNNRNILTCFSGANVAVESALTPTSQVAAGGIAGKFGQGSYIEDSGASGTVRVKSLNGTTGTTGGIATAGGIAGCRANATSKTYIRRCVALNDAVTVESSVAPAYAYRIAGSLLSANNSNEVVGLDDVIAHVNIELQDNYALKDMTVQTKHGTGDWTNVPHTNNTANLTGSGNMQPTQAFLESIGWNFETTWDWDSVAELPFPRAR